MWGNFVLGFLLVLAVCSNLYAVTLSPDMIEIRQPDGILRTRPVGAPPIGMPAQASILDTIQTKGATRVIVRLAAPVSLPGGFALEAELNHIDAINQRSRIRQIQNTVLSRVTIKRAAAAKRYDFIPFMALEVDQSDLEALVASPEIDFIEEDIAVPPLLAQSAPLIGGVNGSFNGYTGSGQTVAILDTGVEKTHPFLTGKVVAEGCYSTSSASIHRLLRRRLNIARFRPPLFGYDSRLLSRDPCSRNRGGQERPVKRPLRRGKGCRYYLHSGVLTVFRFD